MIEVRFHGRAGQGIVTAAELLAVAVAKEGKYSKAFPFFGAEKRGPPVEAFCRIDDKPISFYEQVYNPDIVVVTDGSLLKSVPVTKGLKKDGVVLVNSKKEKKALGLDAAKVFAVDGTAIAMKQLGKPLANTVMLGALAKATGAVKLESLKAALFERFKQDVAQRNYLAIKECCEALKKQ